MFILNHYKHENETVINTVIKQKPLLLILIYKCQNKYSY